MSNVILGTGSYLPERVVSNDELAAEAVDYVARPGGPPSLDQWARKQHGAISRHRVAAHESTSDLATQASRRALENACCDVHDIDLIVLATFTSDERLPPAAAIVQSNLGAAAKYFQLDAACSGFVDALILTDGLLSAQHYRTALVIGAETMSAVTDPRGFKPMTVFGDGSGAVVLARRDQAQGYGIRGFAAGSAGHLGQSVLLRGGGARHPLTADALRERYQYLQFDFSVTHPWAVEHMVKGMREVASRSGVDLQDIQWVVPHQASLNIMSEIAEQLSVPLDKFVITYPSTGNISAASIPVALDDANRRGAFATGDWVFMPAAGAGLAWGAVAYRWFDWRDRS